MCLGVFVLIFKLLKNSKKNILLCIDVMEELICFFLVCVEGFDKVEIIGFCLDMDNDFKIWVGIIYFFVCYNVIGDKVELFFVEFVKLCGIFLS